MYLIISLLFTLVFGAENSRADSGSLTAYDYHCILEEQGADRKFRVVKPLGLGIFGTSLINEFGEIVRDDLFNYYKWDNESEKFVSEYINNDEVTRSYGPGREIKREVTLRETDDLETKITVSYYSKRFASNDEYELFYERKGKCEKEAVVLPVSNQRCYMLSWEEKSEDTINTHTKAFEQVVLALNEEGNYIFGWPNTEEENYVTLHGNRTDDERVYASIVNETLFELEVLSPGSYSLSASGSFGYEKTKSIIEISCMNYSLLEGL